MYRLVAMTLLTAVLLTASTGFPQDGLRDVKAPVSFPSNLLLWIIIAGALTGMAAFVIIRKRSMKKDVIEEEPVDPRTPWEIACEEFDRLEKDALLEEGQFKRFYSRLSGIVREYFENRFHVKAPEMTTEEFLRSLERSQDLSGVQKTAMKKFLNSCDIVKFAKYIPGMEEGRASFKLARELIDETKPDEQLAKLVNGKKAS